MFGFESKISVRINNDSPLVNKIRFWACGGRGGGQKNGKFGEFKLIFVIILKKMIILSQNNPICLN